jgi:methyl-accepting chemotaxis protein
MATAANEQSAVTQDVSRNVVNISQLAERTARDAEQTTEVSDRLMALSEQLESLVRRFRF